jgi:hypothetical protein
MVESVMASDYLVQEVDGVGKFVLEDGTGFILLETSGGVVPAIVDDVDVAHLGLFYFYRRDGWNWQ